MIRMYLILAGLIAVAGAYFAGHHYGWVERDQEMQLAIAAKNEEARSKELELAHIKTERETALKEAKNETRKKESAMLELANAGRLRLPTSCVQAPTNTNDARRDQPEDGTELERQTIASLISIAADGDRAIHQLNACIDWNNQVMEVLNDKR
jgi:hypothetical protein